MSERWRRIMVDGQTAQRSPNDGSLPLKLRRCPRGELHTRQPICEPDAGTSEERQHVKSCRETEEEGRGKVATTVPRLQVSSDPQRIQRHTFPSETSTTATNLHQHEESAFHSTVAAEASLERALSNAIAHARSRYRVLASTSSATP